MTGNDRRFRNAAALTAAIFLITGCLTDEEAAEEAFAVDVNSTPSISGTAPLQITAGNEYRFKPTVSDPDGDALTCSISGLPRWASFDVPTGTLSGRPQSGDVGTYSNIYISVSDGTDSASVGPFAIVVVADNSNSAPSISGNAPAAVTAGNTYTFRPTATDADGDPLSFSVSNRPAWASFNGNTGQLSGTPKSGDVGNYSNIAITVTDGSASASLSPFAISVIADNSNSAPSISGNPPSAVTAGNTYTFQPTATDADGDVLGFSISNRPAWASFDENTGQLSGTPEAGDVGSYPNIIITVTDGSASASLSPFTISVNAIATGSVTLSWTAPTENEDGSALTDLDGYNIYWGTTPGSYTESVTIDNESITTYVVENISQGTYEFVATSFNSSGVESRYSSPVTKVVQ